MADIYFTTGDGKRVAVSAANPLPTAGGAGGGGMTPEDIEASSPATWDAETATVGVSVGTGGSQAAAGDHKHAAGDISSGTLPVSRVPDLPISKITELQNALDALSGRLDDLE